VKIFLRQLVIKSLCSFPPTRRMFLHYLGKSEPTKCCIFIFFLPKVVLLLVVNIAKILLFTFFDTLADILSKCFVFILQQPAIKLIEMLAKCAVTNMETISPFIDSNIVNVMLQTHPDFTSRFLNS